MFFYGYVFFLYILVNNFFYVSVKMFFYVGVLFFLMLEYNDGWIGGKGILLVV